jgi:P27 family predicted phage terminase small subunit
VGRPRKPHRLRVLEGGRGHSRPLTPDLPAPTDPLVAPRGLAADERAAWREHAAAVRQLGLESSVDRGQFLGMVRAYCRARKADRVLARRGLTMSSLHSEIQRPEVAISDRCWAHYERVASKFGLDPQARAKLAPAERRPEKAGDVPPELADASAR